MPFTLVHRYNYLGSSSYGSVPHDLWGKLLHRTPSWLGFWTWGKPFSQDLRRKRGVVLLHPWLRPRNLPSKFTLDFVLHLVLESVELRFLGAPSTGFNPREVRGEALVVGMGRSLGGPMLVQLVFEIFPILWVAPSKVDPHSRVMGASLICPSPSVAS